MICIGIESTAHTFGVGIVGSDGKILADARSMYKPRKGGVIPGQAADYHASVAANVLESALGSAGLELKDVDMVAFARGPGLPPCLKVGASLARYISLRYGKPLVGVNHPVAHIEIGRLTTSAKDPILLYLSGGNTQVVGYADGLYRVFGETEDIPVGNAFDVVARAAGLKMPGGPEIEKLGRKGKYVELPYVVKGMDLSFSGIAAEAVRRLEKGTSKEDICYSLQEVCFSMLAEVSERALAHTGKNELLLVGGVAANKRLQTMLRTMCRERKANFYVVDPKYSGDNGTMIAWAGLLAYGSGERTKASESTINPNWRIDEVNIKWFKK